MRQARLSLIAIVSLVWIFSAASFGGGKFTGADAQKVRKYHSNTKSGQGVPIQSGKFSEGDSVHKVGCCDPPYSGGERVVIQTGSLAGESATVVCCDSDDPVLTILLSVDGHTDLGGSDQCNPDWCDSTSLCGQYPSGSFFWVGCTDIVRGGDGCLIPGDADGNGTVTPGDAQVIFNCFLIPQQCSSQAQQCGDLCPAGGDDHITPGDAQGAFNIFLGISPPCQ